MLACGEGQPLGVPLAGGGPYFGFICTKEKFVRNLPGRLVGKTNDQDGNTGYVLTLQAREQHIRRAKATSNICTNQGLLVSAATIYMSVMGSKGLVDVATRCFNNAKYLIEQLEESLSIKPFFTGNNFFEIVYSLDVNADECIEEMANKGFLAGVSLSKDYKELDNAILICVQ